MKKLAVCVAFSKLVMGFAMFVLVALSLSGCGSDSARALNQYDLVVLLVDAADAESKLPHRYALLKHAEKLLKMIADRYPKTAIGKAITNDEQWTRAISLTELRKAVEGTWKRFCDVPLPSYECPVAEALAEARTIDDAYWRSVALRSISRLQIEAGDYEAALATAHWIDFVGWDSSWQSQPGWSVFTKDSYEPEADPVPGELIEDYLFTHLHGGANIPAGVDSQSARTKSYLDIVLALADNGQGREARDAAEFIRHSGYRQSALFHASLSLARVGDAIEALKTVDAMPQDGAGSSADLARQHIAFRLATVNKVTEALEIAKSIEISDRRDMALGGIAIVLAKAGHHEEALAIVKDIAYSPYRERVKIVALAQSGKGDEAVALATKIIQKAFGAREKSDTSPEAILSCGPPDHNAGPAAIPDMPEFYEFLPRLESILRQLGSGEEAMRNLRIVYWAADRLVAAGLEEEARALVGSVESYPCRSDFLAMVNLSAEKWQEREKNFNLSAEELREREKKFNDKIAELAEFIRKEESLAEKLRRQVRQLWNFVRDEDKRDEDKSAPIYRVQDLLRVASDLADISFIVRDIKKSFKNESFLLLDWHKRGMTGTGFPIAPF